MQEAMEGAGLRGGRRWWAADEGEAAAVVGEEAAAAAVERVGNLETRAGMVGVLDPPGRRRFQKGFDWRNLWSSYVDTSEPGSILPKCRNNVLKFSAQWTRVFH
ncbi:hypothetical protein R6Z07F_018681 [Ovis aries]